MSDFSEQTPMDQHEAGHEPTFKSALGAAIAALCGVQDRLIRGDTGCSCGNCWLCYFNYLKKHKDSLFEINTEWKPTPAAVNALPEPLRRYIHDLETNTDPAGIIQENAYLRENVLALEHWLADCQSGIYINCVYCGHRYGPSDEVPATMADMLKEHVESCVTHPMSKLRTAADYAVELIENYVRRKCSDWDSDLDRAVEVLSEGEVI